MSTRMDRYSVSARTASRAERNQHLYNSIDDINVDHIDVNDDREIDLRSVSNDVNSREEYRKVKEIRNFVSDDTPTRGYIKEEEKEEEKVYDINEILNRAKENKLFEEEKNKKRSINTEYNILTKLDLEHIEEEKEEMKKENLRHLIDTIYSNTLPVDLKKATNAQEDKPLLGDLMQTNLNLDVDISKEILDNDVTEEKVNTKEKIDRQELTDLINKTFIGTLELEKRNKEEKDDTKEETGLKEAKEDEFGAIEASDKKFIAVIIVISLLIALSIIAIIVLKKTGVF